MSERYAWLTFACVLYVLLNVSLSQAADDEEHVHIKVRMPELARKHPKLHKYQRTHYHKSPYSVQLISHHPTYHAAKYKKRAIKPISYPNHVSPLAPPPRRPQPLLTHNYLDMGGIYGDSELGVSNGGGEGIATSLRGSTNPIKSPLGGIRDNQLLYTPSLAQQTHDLSPNYGPAVFGNIDSGGGVGNNNEQHYAEDATTTMLTMPGSSQQLMQHMEIMGALAAAAAAAAAAAGSGEVEGGTDAAKVASAGVGGGGDETNTLLANDFLAQLQSAYANGGGKYPTANVFRRKKKHRVETLAGHAAETYRVPQELQQQQAQQQQQELLKQQYRQQQQQATQLEQQQQGTQEPSAQQHFYDANYITQNPKHQALIYEGAPTGQSNNNNAHYKNKYYYKSNNNNNDIYVTPTTDANNLGFSGVVPTTAEGDEEVDEVDDNAEEDDDLEDDGDTSDGGAPAFYYSTRLTTASAATPLTSLTTAYNGISDYEDAATDDRRQQFVYKSKYNNKYQPNNNYYEGDINPVSFQSAVAYAAAPHVEQPLTPATTLSHLKLHRPYRQLQQKQQKYAYNTFKAPAAGYSAYQQLHGLHQLQQPQQQQHLITTAQPINVIGPTASDFDEPQQHKHAYSTLPALAGGLSRHKKRNKNRIKAKLNRNRIPTQ